MLAILVKNNQHPLIKVEVAPCDRAGNPCSSVKQTDHMYSLMQSRSSLLLPKPIPRYWVYKVNNPLGNPVFYQKILLHYYCISFALL